MLKHRSREYEPSVSGRFTQKIDETLRAKIIKAHKEGVELFDMVSRFGIKKTAIKKIIYSDATNQEQS